MKTGLVGVSFFLITGLVACSSNSPKPATENRSPVRKEAITSPSGISGEIEMVGGRWPGRQAHPANSVVVVTNSARAVVKQVNVAFGIFKFSLPKGDYEVSVHLEQEELKCGPPQRITVPAKLHTSLHFTCPIK
jgi:hypothetical protein